MSKTVKQDRTKGFISRIEHQRKERKLARDFKAMMLLENFIDPPENEIYSY